MDPDTFLTTLYVFVDECCTALPAARRSGPEPALARSEAVTLALYSQWGRFDGERDFYRHAERCLRGAFPRLPHRTQFNRQVRRERDTIVAVGHAIADRLDARTVEYEVLDATAAPVRNAKRSGSGWLAGQAALGRSSRLGWYEGFAVLIAASPAGVITGHGFGPGNTKDQTLAETFFAARRAPQAALPSAGRPSGEPYLADAGFIGATRHAGWARDYLARVVCPPYRSAARNWPPTLRRWLAARRQMIESVNGQLVRHFRLDRDRPHSLDGFAARLAAKVALHNACCWLNRRLGRPTLAFAGLLGW